MPLRDAPAYVHRFTDESQQKRYRKKFAKFELRNNDTIYYKPLNLQVIEKKDIQRTLQKEFKDNGLGKGVVALYKHIQSKYIGIRREDVHEFLSENAQYQMAKPKKHRINKPILASKVGELFAVDLIDMNLHKKGNKGFRYIFSCIDVFSRYSHLEPLKDKTAEINKQALKRIITRSKVKPNSIMCDNGKEFLGAFKDYCEEQGIELRNTRTYSPQSNSVVERLNLEVRKVLRHIFVKKENILWCNKLNEVEQAKNTTHHTTIKTTPETVWKARDVNDVATVEDRITKRNINQQTKDNLETRANNLLKKFKETEFEVGDIVRVAMKVVFTDIRRIIKEGNTKQLIVWYLPRLFRVKRVINPVKNHLERNQYTLQDVEFESMLTHPKSTSQVRVYGSDLIKTNLNDTSDMTEKKALELNQAKSMIGIDLRLYP